MLDEALFWPSLVDRDRLDFFSLALLLPMSSDPFSSPLDQAAQRSTSPSALLRPTGGFPSLFVNIQSAQAAHRARSQQSAQTARSQTSGESTLKGVFERSKPPGFFVVLEDVVDVCGGRVGTSGNKLCIRSKKTCDVNQHSKNRVSTLVPGLYLRSGSDIILESPFLDLSRTSDTDIKILTSKSFATFDDAKSALDDVAEHYRKAVKRDVKMSAPTGIKLEYASPPLPKYGVWNR